MSAARLLLSLLFVALAAGTAVAQGSTVQSLVDQANPGDVVLVPPGSYDELVVVQTDDLTLLGEGDVTLRGLVLKEVSGAWVEGFDIDAVSTGKPGVLIDGGATQTAGCFLVWNDVHDTDPGQPGIDVVGAVTGLTVLANTVGHNGADGIHLGDPGAQVDAYFEQNLVADNAGSGLFIDVAHDVVLVGNTLNKNSKYGVERDREAGAGDPSAVVLRHNRIAGNSGAEVAGQSSDDIANYDQILGAPDQGNQSTWGDEGLGIDRDYPPAQGQPITVQRPIRWEDPSAAVHPFSLDRWEQDRGSLPAFGTFPSTRWDPWGGGFRTILGELSPPSGDDPVQIASDWLHQHGYIAGIAAEGGRAFHTLDFRGTRGLAEGAVVVRFEQRVQDVPVWNGIEVAVTADGRVFSVSGPLHDPERAEGAFVLSQAQAEDAVRAEVGLPATALAAGTPLWMPARGKLVPRYFVDLPADIDSIGQWVGGVTAWVDAESGAVSDVQDSNAYAEPAFIEARETNWEPGSVYLNELAGASSVSQINAPGCTGGDDRYALVGEWLTVYDGDAADGVHQSGDPVATPIGSVSWEPVTTSSCEWGVDPSGNPNQFPLFERVEVPESCVDGIDNSGNGRIDCEDGDCAGHWVCTQFWANQGLGEWICGDGLDDDGDGLVDCADPECENACPGTGDSRLHALNAAVRLTAFGRNYMEPYGGLDLDALSSDKRLTVITERPRDRDGTTHPRPTTGGGSFNRRGNPWLLSSAPLDQPGAGEPGPPMPYDGRWTVVLSRSGSETDHDRNGGRGAGVTWHEATHWWTRALNGNLGRTIDVFDGVPSGSGVAQAVDEGYSYYTSSSYLSREGPAAGNYAQTVRFVSSRLDPMQQMSGWEYPYLRYHLTWDKVSPCFGLDVDQCEEFAAYIGAQFIIDASNDTFLVDEDCGTGSEVSIITLAQTPQDVWWTGRTVRGVVEDALNAQAACAVAGSVQYEVQWQMASGSENNVGYTITCAGCDDLALHGLAVAEVLGLATGPVPHTADSVLNAEGNRSITAVTAWPRSSHNRDCRAFHVSPAPGFPPGPAWAGIDGENQEVSSCSVENWPYFIGDLLTQALWDGRRVTADLDAWEASVNQAIGIIRDCSPEEEAAPPAVDCPEVMGDAAAAATLTALFNLGGPEAQALGGRLEGRGLMGSEWGN
jgi:hypothetical protein